MRVLFALSIVIFLASCSADEITKDQRLYETYCASCHIAPDIQDLPRGLWEKSVLPDMAARLGIRDNGYNPYQGLSFTEMEARMASRVYPTVPIIKEEDWYSIKEYILKLAPDTLYGSYNDNQTEPSDLFKSEIIKADENPGAYYTYLGVDKSNQELVLGDIQGNLGRYNVEDQTATRINHFESGITNVAEATDGTVITLVGNLNPSEVISGRILSRKGNSEKQLGPILHRPVFTVVQDLDGNGKEEIIVNEFGHLTGAVSLLKIDSSESYVKEELVSLPGSIKTVAIDMNGDQKLDLVTLLSQGDEGVVILYQEEDLSFSSKRVIRMSPIYGTSWFELVDMNGDSYLDIVIVNGDNADKTIVPKPYHGLRIFLNDQKGAFSEAYFHGINGATRFVADDFDQDGDIDFGVISTFPDYEHRPEESFVYLENISSDDFAFKTFSIEEAKLGHWLLMESADFDHDGDMDIVLSSFTYSFVPVPDDVQKGWQEADIDLLLLRNNLN